MGGSNVDLNLSIISKWFAELLQRIQNCPCLPRLTEARAASV